MKMMQTALLVITLLCVLPTPPVSSKIKLKHLDNHIHKILDVLAVTNQPNKILLCGGNENMKFLWGIYVQMAFTIVGRPVYKLENQNIYIYRNNNNRWMGGSNYRSA